MNEALLKDHCKQILTESFYVGLKAVEPQKNIERNLPNPPKGKTIVVGAGKASASMASAIESFWDKKYSLEGVVITRYGYSVSTKIISVVEAGHPIPDSAGISATKKILDYTKSLEKDDLMIFLASGGGSSLLSMPFAGISLNEIAKLTDDLLKSGASILEINAVRKHLSPILGGKLGLLCKSPIFSLIISDVTGDDPSTIASGPTCYDLSTYGDSLDILSKFNINTPKSIYTHLNNGRLGLVKETPKSNDLELEHVNNKIIASSHVFLEAAANFFRQKKIFPVILGDTIKGEASEVAKVFAALVREIKSYHQPFKPPVAILSGGECTVTVKGKGKGGPCLEFLLSLVIELEGMQDVFALSADTDGIDGTESNAGGFLFPIDNKFANEARVSAANFLENNDSYGYFKISNTLFFSGPTFTNVNDYRVILVL